MFYRQSEEPIVAKKDRDNITLSERRGSALTDVSNEGMDGRLDYNLINTDKVQELQRKLLPTGKVTVRLPLLCSI